LVGKRIGENLFYGHVVSFSNAPSLLVQILRYLDAYAHNLLSRIFKISDGVSTSIPNRAAPSKSFLLCVTIVAPHCTANSRIRSSSVLQTWPETRDRRFKIIGKEEVLREIIDLLLTDSWQQTRAFEHVFIFQRKSDGNIQPESALVKQADQPIRCSSVRP
jgi:hypothetical protein